MTAIFTIADESEANNASSADFQWMPQWYPVAVVEFLDPSKPHAFQLLGKNVVLWRDGAQQWQCFEDACPHRLAPLSEGRVEADGTLLCAYHGWRFGGDGNCTKIPQSQSPELEAQHRANPKSCAISYPTQQAQGLLWVWAESGAKGAVESKNRSPRIISELEGKSDRVVKLFWNIRDLPYGWDYFMENVADPAHVPVSHHGLVGDRHRDAKYYDMPRLREISTQEGFSFGVTQEQGSPILDVLHDFQPPCLMKITTTFTDEGQLILVLYATPTRPGWCRHIGTQILVKNPQGKLPPGLGFFALPMPTWLGHILASLFLHQDMVFLHYQERTMAAKDRWLDAVYTPNPQDKMTITFRQWLEKRAGGGVPWQGTADLPPAELDKRKLLDVWHTHTAECQYCQTALKRLRWARTGSYGLAIAILVVAVLLESRSIALTGQTSLISLAFVARISIALGLTALGYGIHQLIGLFYVYEFEHAQND
ncbi:Rieske 2Fe-2S domain-containing protein [Chamaesiphon minutus]|uniref:Ring-hydroxylating dioxygenase, large terminal subunit n=1 Tax=Chamaesiphon minutus (strain ATCC 27169 / PCC 6605) TaxID=1173020 RepID=K9UMA3_CHAP6|nr:Rieske 2Fe-2S domain-containing protein [Chamaesiphon minutus]AFY95955.1 ring-hydroxylating dioxygenase, large terminal subunit [Chamaesiphon minutus PCC 6605]